MTWCCQATNLLVAVRQQAITWTNVGIALCRHVASLGHNDLISIIFQQCLGIVLIFVKSRLMWYVVQAGNTLEQCALLSQWWWIGDIRSQGIITCHVCYKLVLGPFPLMFQTWLLIGSQHSYHPIKIHVRKSLWTNMDLNILSPQRGGTKKELVKDDPHVVWPYPLNSSPALST